MSYNGPLNPLPDTHEVPFSLYGYIPNKGFNVFAAVVWGLMLVAHIWWLTRKKTRAIQGLIVFGCFWELIGYAIRAHAHTRPFRADLFIAQYTVLQTAPIFFIMALVSALGWGMRGPDNAGVYAKYKPRSLVAGLQVLNVIVLFLVTIGSTMFAIALARSANQRAIGYDGDATREVLIAGDALKIVSLLTLLAILTHLLIHFSRESIRITRHGHDNAPTVDPAHTTSTTTSTGHTGTVDQTATTGHNFRGLTKLFLGISSLTAGMLLMKTCYRLGETAQNVFGRAWNSQVLFGLFEFAITWVVVAIWAAGPFATLLVPTTLTRQHHGAASDKARV